ncbi:MAG: UDP-glucose dehydrogenase family protein [Candidatus Heimdallarchaeota archaeon]
MSSKNILTIVGTGFVGLVTSAIFADNGYQTMALDINKEIVNKVNNGEAHFFEPHLQELLERVVLKKKTLIASSEIIESIKTSSITFICVGTPSKEDGTCDLQYIENVAKDIGRALESKKEYHQVIVKSTVVPGTTRTKVKEIIEKNSNKQAGKDFGLCMCPEFLREGQSIHDTLYPDRIIIGQYDEQSGTLAEKLFKDIYLKQEDEFVSNWFAIYGKKSNQPPILRFPIETAECIKYANNSFLATKISFINEFANICERIEGVDINDVATGIGLDFRINSNFLRAGAGFGGSCFPKDLQAIINFAHEQGYQPKLLESVVNVNHAQAKRMVELAEEKLGSLQQKQVAILGLSFKPETDDMRNAPSILVINSLIKKGANVIAWDPEAINEAKKEEWVGNEIIYTENYQEALNQADVCLLLTEWSVFKGLKPRDFKNMKQPIIIDGRRIYDSKEFLKSGIEYTGIGLGTRRDK